MEKRKRKGLELTDKSLEKLYPGLDAKAKRLKAESDKYAGESSSKRVRRKRSAGSYLTDHRGGKSAGSDLGKERPSRGDDLKFKARVIEPRVNGDIKRRKKQKRQFI